MWAGRWREVSERKNQQVLGVVMLGETGNKINQGRK